MERDLFIELLEDGEKVSLYSPHFDGEEYTEFENSWKQRSEKHCDIPTRCSFAQMRSNASKD